MLSIKNLTKKFGNTTALNDVSFDTAAGKIFGILGPNGAGKSTILRSILGIVSPDSGSIIIDGKPHNDYSTDNIGYLPEERGLYQRSKVIDVIKHFGKLKSLNKKTLHRNLDIWANKFELEDSLKKYVFELSKGNQQKVQFLISILHDPKILILDEPFSGFDPINQELIKKIIQNFSAQGKIILVSTHLLELAEKFCTDIALLNKGKVILSGNLNSIKSEYKSSCFSVILKDMHNITFNNDLIENYILRDEELLITVKPEITGSQLLNYLMNKTEVLKFNKFKSSLSDIFIQAINQTKNL